MWIYKERIYWWDGRARVGYKNILSFLVTVAYTKIQYYLLSTVEIMTIVRYARVMEVLCPEMSLIGCTLSFDELMSECFHLRKL